MLLHLLTEKLHDFFLFEWRVDHPSNVYYWILNNLQTKNQGEFIGSVQGSGREKRKSNFKSDENHVQKYKSETRWENVQNKYGARIKK